MAVINPATLAVCASVAGKLGRSNGFGGVRFGFSFFGDTCREAGIYRRQPSKKGQVVILQKSYRPTYRNTFPQQTNREKFANAVLAWQNLTTEERLVYNQMKYPVRLSGYHRFMRINMRS
jgi:hypothetical protein